MNQALVTVLICFNIFIAHSALAQSTSLKAATVAIPGGQGGIGFDDMVYSTDLHKVIIPAGHTGKIYLIDPVTFKMEGVSGFSSSPQMKKGHEVGVTSADEGEGYLFGADHSTGQLLAVDLKSGSIAASAYLDAEADYVRYVTGSHEIWITEPHNKQLEVFKFVSGAHPVLTQAFEYEMTHLTQGSLLFFPVGPESLMIDHLRNHAYVNLGPNTAAIDLTKHAVISTWPNGCTKSRGDALDEQRGFLFVTCGDGTAEVFDVNHNYQKLSTVTADPAPDVISYNQQLAHLYLSSAKNATLTVIGVSAKAKLSILGTAAADKRSHCVVSDDQNNIWVCDPPKGQLLRFKDTFPIVQ